MADFFDPTISADIAIDPQNSELVVDIDTDMLDAESQDEAKKMCRELQDMYFTEEFMKLHPTLVNRIRQEIYALYVLLKMRKSDEIIHDLNIKSIASNPSNASLYRALKDTQASLLSIQTKIDDKVKDIQTILKDKQTEMNFEETTQNESQEESGDKTSFRGSKAFIEEMQKKQKELSLFDFTNEEEG